MWLSLAVVGVVLTGWLLLTVLLQPATQTTSEPTPTATVEEQSTLLIQARNDSDLGAGNLVGAEGGGLPGVQLLAPSRLVVDVPSQGQRTLGQTARLIDRRASEDALGDLLALRIDGTLSLGRLALAGMVDYVGGITIDVDREITVTDEESGAETVLVPEGQVHLDGTQAAAYALAWLPDEPETARMARYSQVMTATIGALPEDQLRVEQMLTALGGSARTTAANPTVAGILLGMRSQILAGSQLVRTLPTAEPAAEAGLGSVSADLVAAGEVLGEVLPQAQLPPEEARPRVVVRNGVGRAGLGAHAREELVGAGMVYINGGNADELGNRTTDVYVGRSAEDQVLGGDLADALGVPAGSVKQDEDVLAGAEALVVLGADFEP
ncbi:MAG: LCP family protein [Candidatus Nanopelagicales bacterium]